MEVDYCRVYDTPPAQPAHVSHLALNKPVTASSYKNTGGIPDRAVDGADSSGSVTRWESNWEDPTWIRVDLQAICSINKVILNWQYAAAASYQIQVSSDSWGPWTNCISVTGGTYGWVTNSFSAQTGRYVRLYGTARTTPYGYSLFDMQVYGTVVNPNPGDPPARPNLALNQPTTVSSYQTNSPYCPGSYAVDGDLSTRWATAWSDPQWIYVDLGKTNPVDTVSIYWEAGAAKAYTVQLANSASGPWTVVYSTTNSSAGLKNIEFPSQNARFVKVNGTARTTAYGYSIYELQVYGGGATNVGTVPPAPTGLTATAVSSSQINLSWSASSGATSYNVKRATVSGGPYTTIATGVTATSYSDTGLSASTTYYYVVSAVNSAGESPNSSQASATTSVAIPPAPTGLTATAVSSNQINLSWSASSGATSYNVKRATVSGGPYTTIATGVTATSYNNTGLAASTTYYYVVSAVNSSGESPNSSQASATTLSGGTAPPAPTGLSATAVATNQINLTWTASSGATSYNVKRATVSGGPYTTIATGVTATSYNNTGLSANTTYYYVVSAVNTYGESANSSQASATTLSGGTAPPAPTGLSATAVATNQINLTWTASSGATSYNVKRSTTSGGPYTTIATGVTATSYSNTGLSANTTYYYVVSAVNTYGESANSSQASATTPQGGGGDVLLSQGKPVTASSSQSGNPATNGNDGSLSTRWAASSGSYPQWWRVDLGANHALHTVVIDWLNAASTGLQLYH